MKYGSDLESEFLEMRRGVLVDNFLDEPIDVLKAFYRGQRGFSDENSGLIRVDHFRVLPFDGFAHFHRNIVLVAVFGQGLHTLQSWILKLYPVVFFEVLSDADLSAVDSESVVRCPFLRDSSDLVLTSVG